LYVIACSPYRNGAYLVRVGGSSEEYSLYCCCEGEKPTRWNWLPVRACEVSKAAHNRGYGTLDEIWPQAIQRNLNPGSTSARTSI